jgi:hypothetical protein
VHFPVGECRSVPLLVRYAKKICRHQLPSKSTKKCQLLLCDGSSRRFAKAHPDISSPGQPTHARIKRTTPATAWSAHAADTDAMRIPTDKASSGLDRMRRAIRRSGGSLATMHQILPRKSRRGRREHLVIRGLMRTVTPVIEAPGGRSRRGRDDARPPYRATFTQPRQRPRKLHQTV